MAVEKTPWDDDDNNWSIVSHCHELYVTGGVLCADILLKDISRLFKIVERNYVRYKRLVIKNETPKSDSFMILI